MKVLFIAYYFPPDSSSGSFRPLFFINNFVEMGIDVCILTARVEDYLAEQVKDRKLLGKVHDRVKITRCSVLRPREMVIDFKNKILRRKKLSSPASEVSVPQSHALKRSDGSWWQSIKDVVTDLLAMPDPHIGWLPDCFRKGRKEFMKEKYDIIIATGSPWTGFIAGVLLKKSLSLPLCLDFRDPWVSNPKMDEYSRLARFLAKRIEKYAVTNADCIIANTSRLKDDFLKRYPDVCRDKRVDIITNGFEKYLPIDKRQKKGALTIAHTGELYFSRNPLPLLKAVDNLIKKDLILADEISLQFVGGMQTEDNKMNDLLNSTALKKVVHIVERVPYNEVSYYIENADMLLLIQPELPLQIPRKLYEYMSARKPIFCITEPGSSTAKIVRDNKLGKTCDNTVGQIEENLLDIYMEWKKGGLEPIVDFRCDSYLNKNLAEKLGMLLKDIVAETKDLNS